MCICVQKCSLPYKFQNFPPNCNIFWGEASQILHFLPPYSDLSKRIQNVLVWCIFLLLYSDITQFQCKCGLSVLKRILLLIDLYLHQIQRKVSPHQVHMLLIQRSIALSLACVFSIRTVDSLVFYMVLHTEYQHYWFDGVIHGPACLPYIYVVFWLIYSGCLETGLFDYPTML